MIECSGLDLLWWQWWILVMITTNTVINLIVFFKHRFKKGVSNNEAARTED